MAEPRKKLPWPLLAPLAAVAIGVGLFLFQPWQLFVDQAVDEAFPMPLSAQVEAQDEDLALGAEDMLDDAPTTEDMPAPAEGVDEPVALVTGAFQDRSHATRGQVAIYALEDGTRILRIEELATDNGPDLFVYLSAAGADAPSGDLDDQFVSLGRLKGNIGSQNYEIPADVDLDAFASVVIWCDRFDVAFGAANLVA